MQTQYVKHCTGNVSNMRLRIKNASYIYYKFYTFTFFVKTLCRVMYLLKRVCEKSLYIKALVKSFRVVSRIMLFEIVLAS